MEYERKYKAALKWMQSLYSGLHGATKEEAEKYFPELKDSEDERIVKCLLNYFNHVRYNGLDLKGTDVDEVITWLEKQGKRLGADEVTKHQWISVEDELPNNYERVIAAFRRHFARICFHCGDTWYLDNPPVAEPMSGITHWMPLPPPPHHIIDTNKKVDRVIGTADHIKTALDVLNKKGGENENP